MKSIKRVVAGRKAKKRGEGFENLLYAEAYRTRWQVIKIPDGCRQIGPKQLVRVRSPFDFVFLKKGFAIFCDAKTTLAKSYSFSDLTIHQVKTLLDIHTNEFTAGYVINFTELNKTVFFDGPTIASVELRSSLKPEDGILVGDNRIILLDRILGPRDITVDLDEAGHA